MVFSILYIQFTYFFSKKSPKNTSFHWCIHLYVLFIYFGSRRLVLLVHICRSKLRKFLYIYIFFCSIPLLQLHFFIDYSICKDREHMPYQQLMATVVMELSKVKRYYRLWLY